MSARHLPDDLASALRAARRVEDAAANVGQQRLAVRATTTLLVAAVDVGWRAVELAPAIAMKPDTVRKRVRDARAGPLPPAGLDLPTGREPDPMDAVLRTPVDEREWLTSHEAIDFAGITPYTLRNWRAAGLLPNARKLPSNRVLYLRADLLRVMRAPKYKRHGPSYQAVRETIAERDV